MCHFFFRDQMSGTTIDCPTAFCFQSRLWVLVLYSGCPLCIWYLVPRPSTFVYLCRSIINSPIKTSVGTQICRKPTKIRKTIIMKIRRRSSTLLDSNMMGSVPEYISNIYLYECSWPNWYSYCRRSGNKSDDFRVSIPVASTIVALFIDRYDVF